jgi:DMSO reductase anchor subunit
LAAWTALALLLSPDRTLSFAPHAAALALAIVLITVGLLSSLAHLGQPQRAWRAFSQWRSSWLSREGVAAILTYLPALALLVAAVWRVDGVGMRLIALLLCAGSLVTVACTAMIYASLPPIGAWRDRAVLPVYLAYALLGGMLWCAMLLAWFGWRPGIGEVAPMMLLAFALAALKLNYWQRIDHDLTLPTAAQATGLSAFGTVRTFERPHTESNYLLREMGFVLARRHARRLRSFALLAGLASPFTALLLAVAWPRYAAILLSIGALAFQLGAMVERWLFFAQARHTVTLYYGVDTPA